MDDDRTAPARPDAGTLSRLEDEVRLVEEEIDQARRASAEFRRRIGERAEGATDLEDRSAAIAQAEEQEELLGILTTRRERLLERCRALSEVRR
jgi:hypothetical protein